MNEIERRIREVRPLSGNRHLPLSDRAKRELADIVTSQSPDGVAEVTTTVNSPRSWFHRFRASRPAIATTAMGVLAVVVAVVWSMRPVPAFAATPPLLTFEPVDQSASELLLELSQRTCEAPSKPADASGDTVIVTHTWTLATEVDADGGVDSSVIRPEIVTTTIRPDGAGTIVAVAGQPFDSDGVAVDDNAISGSPLWGLEFGPGEFGLFGDRDFPDEVGDVEGFLSGGSGFDESSQAADSIDAVESLFLERELECQDRATLLRYLAELPDLDVVGTTVDRLDRGAVALVSVRAVSDSESYLRYLLFDPSTGDLLASETEYVGTERSDIASPATISYFGWE